MGDQDEYEGDWQAERALIRQTIHADIDAERERQDQRWGGPDHDQYHTVPDWITFIVRQLGKASTAMDTDRGDEYRKHMINVAALAVAAIEAWES